MSTKFFVKLATLFGCGYFPVVPGTIGSILGVIFYISIASIFSPIVVVLISLSLILVANIACDMAEKDIGEKDPGCIILDEFVAMPICFFGTRFWALSKMSTLVFLLLGFAIFRILDILKPFGINRVQDLSGGLGIVTDDLVAAIYTNLILTIICLILL